MSVALLDSTVLTVVLRSLRRFVSRGRGTITQVVGSKNQLGTLRVDLERIIRMLRKIGHLSSP